MEVGVLALEPAEMSTYYSVFPAELVAGVADAPRSGHAIDTSPVSVWPTERVEEETQQQAPVVRMY